MIKNYKKKTNTSQWELIVAIGLINTDYIYTIIIGCIILHMFFINVVSKTMQSLVYKYKNHFMK